MPFRIHPPYRHADPSRWLACGLWRGFGPCIHEVVYVLRSPLAAVSAFLFASELGLGYPSWAAVSAIVFLQEDLSGTRTAVHWRMIGTLTGVAVALLCGSALTPLSPEPALQIGISVAACAAIARVRPALRVAMWTVPIVFMSRAADVTLIDAGLSRGCEVLIGGVMATVVQWLVEAASNAGRKSGGYVLSAPASRPIKDRHDQFSGRK